MTPTKEAMERASEILKAAEAELSFAKKQGIFTSTGQMISYLLDIILPEKLPIALDQARQEGYEKGVEDGAAVCDKYAKDLDNEWNKQIGKRDDLVETCEECAEAIRSLIKETV